MENIQMPHLPVREDWLKTNAEAPLEPERRIIDPHHHLWERPGARYLFHDLLADVSAGHNIVSTVYVQCHSMHRADGPLELAPVGEVEFAAGAAAMSESGHYGPSRLCEGIIGTADLMLGAKLDGVLDALEAGANGRLRGIRMPVANSGDKDVVASVATVPQGMMLEESMADGVRALGRRGLTLDIWAFQTQLEEALTLARRAPETVIVIDHVGGVMGIGSFKGRREEAFEGWRASMAALAALPNVRVKLGGLAMHSCGFGLEAEPEQPSSERYAKAWRPYIESCIELFGPERAMFESNFPVDKGQVSYTTLWNAFLRLASGCSETEKDQLFRATAAGVYRLRG